MKTLVTLPLLLLSIFSSPSWSETMRDLYERDGVYYKKFTEIPFTGELTGVVQGRFESGLQEGLWSFYFDSGTIREKGKYKTGVKEGHWISYSPTGQLIEEGEYKNGVKEGYWVDDCVYSATVAALFDGANRCEGSYENGKKDGPWEYYSGDELRAKGFYKSDEKEGTWTSYDSTGKLEGKTDYKEGRLDGPSVEFYESGQLRHKGEYKNGKREGPWVYYDENGALNKVRSGVMKDDVKISD